MSIEAEIEGRRDGDGLGERETVSESERVKPRDKERDGCIERLGNRKTERQRDGGTRREIEIEIDIEIEIEIDIGIEIESGGTEGRRGRET